MMRRHFGLTVIVIASAVTGAFISTAIAAKKDAVPWCVAEDRGPVKPEYNITNGAFIIHWGKLKDNWGEAEYEAHPDQNMVFCELWIEKRPAKVWGDPEMDTLGHELGHCLWGDFHPGYED